MSTPNNIQLKLATNSKTIFLSGSPLTGSHRANLFEERASQISLSDPGISLVYYHAFTQVWDSALKDQPFEYRMRAVIPIMLQCQELYLLPAWHYDLESGILQYIAMCLKTPIIYI